MFCFVGIPENSLDPEEFQKKFTRFLFGSVGSRHRLLLGFEDDITCGEPAPQMTVGMFFLRKSILD